MTTPLRNLLTTGSASIVPKQIRKVNSKFFRLSTYDLELKSPSPSRCSTHSYCHLGKRCDVAEAWAGNLCHHRNPTANKIFYLTAAAARAYTFRCFPLPPITPFVPMGKRTIPRLRSPRQQWSVKASGSIIQDKSLSSQFEEQEICPCQTGWSIFK